MNNISRRTQMIVKMAMMLAMIVVLSYLEHMLPPLPFLPPNVRLGLSNIVTMYTIFFLGRRYAFLLAVLKSGFVGITRGVIAGMLSLSGGLFSIAVVIILLILFPDKITYLLLSIAGAVAHNFAQIVIASMIMSTALISFYWPVLIISGVIIGTVTGSLLRIVMPLMHRIYCRIEKEKREQ